MLSSQMTSFRSRVLRPSVGASFLLALALGACTKEPNNPTFAAPVNNVDANLNAEAKDFADYTGLVWSDEFDGGALNQDKWQYEIQDVWYNNELQATTNSPDNLYLTGGNLVIQAKQQAYNGRNYTSARIVTRGKKDFIFGRIDIRAKMPKGKGIWPAIWMLGSNDATETWPRCGEIDISELRGSIPNRSLSTVHYGLSFESKQEKGGAVTLPAGNFSDDFHLFTVIRSRDQIRFFLDSAQYFTITPTQVAPYPFNNPFYMILNVAVGGNFDGDPDASTVFPQQMMVDYVKYYQYAE
jgi:beta-glucanase (GH16 family)